MTDAASIFHIWNVIVQSNTFNFIVFVAILAWIVKKIDIPSAITALQEKIIKLIEDAKREKEIASQSLANAKKEVENLPQVVDEILRDAEKGAGVIGEKLLSEAKKQIQSIEENAQRTISAEEKRLVDLLSKKTSMASVEAAKTNIKNVLQQTPTLHEKYINSSIDELDRLNF